MKSWLGLEMSIPSTIAKIITKYLPILRAIYDQKGALPTEECHSPIVFASIESLATLVPDF